MYKFKLSHLCYFVTVEPVWFLVLFAYNVSNSIQPQLDDFRMQEEYMVRNVK